MLKLHRNNRVDVYSLSDEKESRWYKHSSIIFLTVLVIPIYLSLKYLPYIFEHIELILTTLSESIDTIFFQVPFNGLDFILFYITVISLFFIGRKTPYKDLIRTEYLVRRKINSDLERYNPRFVDGQKVERRYDIPDPRISKDEKSHMELSREVEKRNI